MNDLRRAKEAVIMEADRLARETKTWDYISAESFIPLDEALRQLFAIRASHEEKPCRYEECPGGSHRLPCGCYHSCECAPTPPVEEAKP